MTFRTISDIHGRFNFENKFADVEITTFGESSVLSPLPLLQNHICAMVMIVHTARRICYWSASDRIFKTFLGPKPDAVEFQDEQRAVAWDIELVLPQNRDQPGRNVVTIHGKPADGDDAPDSRTSFEVTDEDLPSVLAILMSGRARASSAAVQIQALREV